MTDPSNIPTPAPPPEPSAAARGDPMLRAVEVVEAAAQLAASGTGASPATATVARPAAAAASTAPDARALLEKREQQFAQRKAKLEEREREIGAQRAELASRAQAIRDAVARREEYRANPKKALQDAGLTLEDVAQAVLSDGVPPPELLARAAQEDVAQLREELAERDKRAEQAALEARRVERDEARAQVRSEIGSVVQADPEKYELIGFHGKDAEDLVFEAMRQAYREGHTISVAEAADKVEAYLDDHAQRVLKTRKGAARLRPPSAAPGATGATRPGADPMDRAVAELVSRGLTRF